MHTDLLVPVRVWVAAALAGNGTLTSGVIDNRRAKRVDSLLFQLTVASGNPDVKIEYAISEDGTTFGPLTQLVASTATTYSAAPSGVNTVAMTAPLAPYWHVKLTELVNKATTVTLTAELRE